MLTWDWALFFLPQNQTPPPGAGFGLFSWTHLSVLAGLGLGLVALALAYRRADDRRRGQLRLVLGWTTAMLELLRQSGYLLAGWHTPDILPLHLCGFATFVVLADAVASSRWTREFLYAVGWWGALAANLFPNWAAYPIMNIFTWQSFAIHTLILGYVLMRLVSGELVPDPANLWRVAIMVVVFASIGWLANHLWGTNFWFLNTAAPGSPLEGIQQLAGAFYVPVLVVLLMLLWTLLYLPWWVRARRRHADSAPPRPVQ